MHRYWWSCFVFQDDPKRRYQGREWGKKIFTDDLEFTLYKSKVTILINLLRNTAWYTKNLYLNEKRWTVNSTYRCWRGYGKELQEWGVNSREKNLVPFIRQCPAHHVMKIQGISGDLQHGRDQPASLYTWHLFSLLLLFTKVKVTVKGRFQGAEDIKKVTAELKAVLFRRFRNRSVKF
jgi:hypothetical protein